MKSRLFAVPDIHGRFDLLSLLWDTLNSLHCLDLSVDKVIFLGDMIDRGPQSKEVLQFIKELTEKYPNNVIALKGNHETLALNAVATRAYHHLELWFINGGDSTVRSYKTAEEYDPENENYNPHSNPHPNYKGILMSAEHLEWINKLPLLHREEGFFFSHAPILDDDFRQGGFKGEEHFSDHDLTWSYLALVDEGQADRKFDNGVVGVCGHIHRVRNDILQPRFYKHYIYADSGCGCWHKAPLTAVEVTERQVITIWPEQVEVSKNGE